MTQHHFRLGAWACIVSGLLLSLSSPLTDLAADQAIDLGAARVANLISVACVPGLMAGAIALAALHAHLATRAVQIGRLLTLIGLTVWLVAGLYLVVQPDAPQLLTPLGSALMSVGIIVLGVVALRARVLQGWRRFVPLLVGGWFFAQFPLQFALFISQGDHPRYVLLLGVWGVLWASLGAALLANMARRRRNSCISAAGHHHDRTVHRGCRIRARCRSSVDARSLSSSRHGYGTHAGDGAG